MLPPLELAKILPGGDEPAYALTEAEARLRQMVLDTVRSLGVPDLLYQLDS
jgi:hypothetical protein